jgi:hypothetical protein
VVQAGLCFSIETRKENGVEYSAINGFFRQYELTYVNSPTSLRTSATWSGCAPISAASRSISTA